jgi:hypothetical protein
MIVHMAVDVHDQIVRACATPELAEEYLTRRATTAHGTQLTMSFVQDPLLKADRVMVVNEEPWLYGAYRIITQEVLGAEEAVKATAKPAAKAADKS